HIRPGENFLRAAPGHLLAANRSHSGRRPVHRYRTELSRGDFLWQCAGEENCRGFKREARAFGQIQKTDRDRNLASDEILSRGGASPEILSTKPGTLRSVRARVRPRFV